MKCCICSKSTSDGKTLVLTNDEKLVIGRTGVEAPDSYFYCKPCYRISTDRVQGLQLFKGLLKANLEKNGVMNASKIVEDYHAFFLKQGSQPKKS